MDALSLNREEEKKKPRKEEGGMGPRGRGKKAVGRYWGRFCLVGRGSALASGGEEKQDQGKKERFRLLVVGERSIHPCSTGTKKKVARWIAKSEKVGRVRKKGGRFLRFLCEGGGRDVLTRGRRLYQTPTEGGENIRIWSFQILSSSAERGGTQAESLAVWGEGGEKKNRK